MVSTSVEVKTTPVDEGVKTELRVPCEVYSRIVGYLRPVQNWHQGKRQEFSERRVFRLPDMVVESD